METINIQSKNYNQVKSLSKSSKISEILEYAEFNKYGVMSMLLIFIGCLSGTTVGLVAFANDLALISVIIPTMATLSLILSVQPIKYILIGGLVTAIIDILLLITLLF